MQVSQPLHFVTQNRPLAHALTSAGFKLVVIWNRYTDATLDHLHVATAKEAKEKGFPGIITYAFERKPGLQAALDAWDEMGVSLKDRNAKKQGPVGFEWDEKNAVIAVAAARVVMNTERQFMGLWRSQPAIYLRQVGEIKTEEDELGHKVETLPGFKAVSDGLTEAQRRKVFPQ